VLQAERLSIIVSTAFAFGKAPERGKAQKFPQSAMSFSGIGIAL
jgi:hypothetical protein